MKVKDLIQKLSSQNQEAEIYLIGWAGDMEEKIYIHNSTLVEKDGKKYYASNTRSVAFKTKDDIPPILLDYRENLDSL